MKKHLKALVIFFVLLALLTSSGAVSAFALNVEEVSLWDYDYYGDVNGDYNVTVKDATALQKYLAKLSDLDIFSRLKSDVNGDGKLSISDVTDVQKFVAVLIPCFEVDTAFRLVADRNSTIVEGFQEKVYITIPKDGYYCFSSEVSEPSYRAFEVLDGYDYVAGVAGEEPYLEDYAYVKAGLYRADVTFTNDDSRVFETELRVTSANDKMPVDLLNARELKDGDEIEIKAGEGDSVFWIDPASAEMYDLLKIYTKGKDPKVSFEFYDQFHNYMNSVEYDPKQGVNTRHLYDFVVPAYLVVTQEEGGSDFTLCCENYSTDALSEAQEIKLNKRVELEVVKGEDWLTNPYRAFASYKFTPEESGYYKLSYKAENCEDCWADIDPYIFYYPDNLAFAEFEVSPSNRAGTGTSYDYLEKGRTYLISFEVRCAEDVPVSFILEKSKEEEYKASLDYVFDIEMFKDCSTVTLGEPVTHTFEPYEDDNGNRCDEKYLYKLTADKDMTVVAYSEGSYNAYANIYSETGEKYQCDNIVWPSGDFIAIIDMKKGETCYFEISSSGSLYGADTYDFVVTDIDNYNGIY